MCDIGGAGRARRNSRGSSPGRLGAIAQAAPVLCLLCSNRELSLRQGKPGSEDGSGKEAILAPEICDVVKGERSFPSETKAHGLGFSFEPAGGLLRAAISERSSRTPARLAIFRLRIRLKRAVSPLILDIVFSKRV